MATKNKKNTGKADTKASSPIAATGTPKPAAAKVAAGNAPAKPRAKAKVKTAAAAPAKEKKSAIVIGGHTPPSDQSKFIDKIRKGWDQNGEEWTKNFGLPKTAADDAQNTLISKIQYGMVSVNDL